MKTTGAHRHPMQVVSRRTGLNAELLRVWERRYGLVTPARSPTGRRLYSDSQIERLRLLYRATLAGRTIGQIARMPTPALLELVKRDTEEERAAAGERRAADGKPSPLELTDDCLRAIERLDAVALDAVLRRAVLMVPADDFLDGVVTSLLERIGDRWREGTLRPVHGHLATAVLRRVLDRVTETATVPGASPQLVVATPVGQVHELGAMLAAAAAATGGWAVTYLGSGLPAEDIAEAAAAIGARVIGLSIVHPGSDRAIGTELRRLRSLMPKRVKLIVGGAAAASYQKVLADISAERVADLREWRAQLQLLRRQANLDHAR